jgi:hypothetical protein
MGLRLCVRATMPQRGVPALRLISRGRGTRRSWLLMQNQSIAELDIAWAAGFIDGEGCFSIYRRRRRDRPTYLVGVSVSQVKREPLDRLQSLFGGKTYVHKSYRPNQISCCSWRVHSYATLALCRLLDPHLSVKWEQSQLLQQFYAIPPSHHWGRQGLPPEEVQRRDDLIVALRFLNHRGTKPYVPFIPFEKSA